MIGLIGYGRFGKLTVRHLAPDCEVLVHTRDPAKATDIQQAGGRLVSLTRACAQQTVILCVPISTMQATLKRIAPLLHPGTLVVDVCSVKVLPVQWMRRHLPDQVQILASHPMFGPDSATDSLAGHKLVICPERISPARLEPIVAWLKSKRLEVIETTADQHDREIAVSLALTHFIGRSLSAFGAHPLDIDTEGYKRLLHILGVVDNDTWQLFEDMHHYNPYARDKRKAFIEAMIKIDKGLASDADR
jgi:prephenate dehydrogenase